MAFMRKIKDRYYVSLKLRNGRQKTISLKTSNERYAKQRLRKIQEMEVMVKAKIMDEMELLETLQLNGVDSLTISALTKRYLRYCTNIIKPSTKDMYRSAFNDLKVLFGEYFDVRDFRPTDSDRLLDGLKRMNRYIKKLNTYVPKYNATSINIRLRNIKAFLYWCVENQFIKNMPFRIRQLTVDENSPSFLTDDQIKKLFDACRDKQPLIHDAFMIFLNTGMRRGELQNSELLENNFLKIYAEKTYMRRIIPFPPELTPTYQRIKKKNYRVGYFTKRFKYYREKAELPEELSLHSLRHSYAVRHWLTYGDILLTKQALGHKSVKTTEIYTEIPTEYLKQVCQIKQDNRNKSPYYFDTSAENRQDASHQLLSVKQSDKIPFGCN